MDFPNFSDLLDSGYALRPSNTWPTYVGGQLDRQRHVSASEIGNCARRIKFGKEAASKPFTRWGFAERGHMIEAWAVPLIRDGIAALPDADDWLFLFAGERQVSFYEGAQSGTPDGLLVHVPSNKGLCVDFKSLDPRAHRKNLPKKNQIDQIQQNIDLLNHLTTYDVVAGLLFYIDASDLQNRTVKHIESDWRRQEQLQERAEWIMAANSPDDLPAEGLHMDKQCDQCEFQNKCSDLIRSQQQDALEMKRMERAANVVFGKS